MARKWVGIVRAIVTAVVALALLYVVWVVAASGQIYLAISILVMAAAGFYVYIARPAYTWRYLFPGLLAAAVFVILPLAYTVRLGFTNYSSKNLLTFERSTQYLLEQTVAGQGQRYQFTVHQAGDRIRMVFTPAPATEGDAAAEPAVRFAIPELDPARAPETVTAAALPAGEKLSDPLTLRDVIKLRPALSRLKVKFPDGTQATMASLREFAPLQPAYRKGEGNTLVNVQTGEVLTANFKTGFYETPAGEGVRPGFKVDVGLANYVRTVTDSALTAAAPPDLRLDGDLLAADGALHPRGRDHAGGGAELGAPAAAHGLPDPALPALRGPGLHLDPGLPRPLQPELRRAEPDPERPLRPPAGLVLRSLPGQVHDPDREHLAGLPVHHGALHRAHQGDPRRSLRGLGHGRRRPAPELLLRHRAAHHPAADAAA